MDRSSKRRNQRTGNPLFSLPRRQNAIKRRESLFKTVGWSDDSQRIGKAGTDWKSATRSSLDGEKKEKGPPAGVRRGKQDRGGTHACYKI